MPNLKGLAVSAAIENTPLAIPANICAELHRPKEKSTDNNLTF
jgi:hypothetical protein